MKPEEMAVLFDLLRERGADALATNLGLFIDTAKSLAKEVTATTSHHVCDSCKRYGAHNSRCEVLFLGRLLQSMEAP